MASPIDTTGDSVEVYDYSDITDSEEEEPVSKKSTRQPHPTSNHMDVTIRKQFVDVDEIKRKVDADTNTIQKQFGDMVGQMKGNSGQSTRVSCLLLILTLTVHWMFMRFSMSRRPRPRRVIQIRRRPAHLH